jgi:energy-coupling factor transport system ATP-binding protein
VIEIVESLRREKHTTVILVEHEPEDVLRLADRLAVVAEGEIVWYGRPAQLFRDVAFTQKLSIRSPQMAQLGYELSQAGLIALDEIPLSVDEAEPLVRRVVAGKRLGVESDGHGSSNEEDRTPVIEVKGLTHTYQGGIQALSGINLTIRQGEFVAAVGQNGAGKTTLVKHFNGLLKPTSGTVLVQGLDTKDHEVRELARHVGYVFQNPDHQIFCSTVAEEIGYGLRNLGMSEDEREQRISDALGVVGLESKRDQHPFNLGKGERQKVAVASILAISPPIIVIDEPTTGLDWAGIAAMMNLIQDLHRQGHTIIMVTHNMQIVAEYAQRVIVMSSGKVSMDGPPDKVFTDISALHQASLEPTPMNVLARRLGDLGCPSNVLTVGQMMQAITHAGIQG